MPRYYDPDETSLSALVEQRAKLYDQYRLTTTPEIAQNVANMASVWGRTLKPGALYSLGAAGLTYDGEEVQAAVTQSLRSRPKSTWDKMTDRVSGAFAAAAAPIGEALDTGYDVAKGFSRGAFAGTMFVPELIQGSFRALANDRDDNFGSILNQTTLGAAHDEIQTQGGYAGLLTGKTDVDYGDGFFVQAGSQANSRVGRRQRDEALAAGRRADGRAISLGRSFADLFVEDSGGRRHRILSGLVDGVVALADPSVMFGGAAAKGIKASRQLTRGDWTPVAGAVVDDTPAKAKARVFAAGGATGEEFAEDLIRHGSDNPRLKELRNQYRVARRTERVPVDEPALPSWEGGPSLFHGTSREFKDGKLAPRGYRDSGANNLFGFGFYATDAEDVARSYTKKGGGESKQVYGLRWTGATPPRFLDLQQTAAPALRQAISSSRAVSDDFDTTVEAFDALKAAIADPNISGAELMQRFRTAVADAEITKGEADELYAALADALEDAGFDGMKHLGGVATGNKQHNAHIFFDPGKLEATPRLIERERPMSKQELAQELEGLRGQIEVDAGLVPGHTRLTAVPQQAAKWLESKDFNDLAEHLAGMDNFNEIRRLTGKKLPVQLVDELASQAHTPDQVKDAIARAINEGSLTEKFGLPGVGKVRRKRPSRLAARLPGTHLTIDDPDELVEFADRYMRNAHLDEATINTHAQAFARAQGRQGVYQAFDNMMKSVERQLINDGTDPLIARGLTRAWEKYKDDVAYNLDRTGNEQWMTKVMVNGKIEEIPHPHLYREYVNRQIPLPNLREIRMLTSNKVVRAMLDEHRGTARAKTGSALNDVADYITNEVWTPLRLIRGGFVIRNIAEAQMRMATGGYDNVFTDPFAFLAWAVGDGSSKTARLLAKGGIKTGRGSLDPTGASYKRKSELARGADEFGRALSRNGSLWRTSASGKRKVGGFVRVTQDKGDEFLEGWAAEMADLATDEVADAIVKAKSLDDAKHWFAHGEGRKYLDDFMQDDDFAQKFGANPGAYIDSVYQRIMEKTGGSTELIDLIRTAHLRNTPLWNNHVINKAVLPHLRDLLGHAPEVVKGSRMTMANAEHKGHWKRFVDASFDLIASRPENFMNNSPVFRQEHWRASIQLAGHLRPEDQAKLLQNAQQAKLPKKLIKELERNSKQRSGQLALEDVSKLAAQRALKAQRKLLYNAYDKQQFFDVFRSIFVFGDALRNTAQVWPRLLAQNPGSVGRFGAGFQGVRDADTDGDGRGFFYRDPTTGKEVFAFPGSSVAVKAATGLGDTPLTAPVEGLNLLTQSVVPSLGPVSAFAASVVLPDRAEMDGVRKILLPFGDPDLVNQILPPFAAKFVTGLSGGWSPAQMNQFASTVAEVTRHLESTGKYNLGDPADYEQLLVDAKDKAKWLFVVRGVAQFFAPSPPSPRHIAYDKNGKVWETIEMSRIYREYLNEFGMDEAMPRFIEDFGQLAFSATVNKTDSLGTAAPTKEALDFVRAHPDIARRYKRTYGLFLAGDGPIDLRAYGRQIESGERRVKSPEEFVAEVRQRLARSLYEAGKEVYGEDRQMLSQLRSQLEARFEFNNKDFNPGEAKGVILELQQAAQEPALARTPAGKALRAYLQARQKALAVAQERGIQDISRHGGAADLRGWLREIGELAMREHPEFSNLWDRVLSREIGEEV